MPRTPQPPGARGQRGPAARKSAARAAASARPVARPSKAAPAKPAARPARSIKPRLAASPKAAATPAVPLIPKLGKDELRAEVERLTAANATLRARGRELTRGAKAATARVAELEAEMARLARPAARTAASSSARDGGRVARGPRRREIDPGDAVPPGVAMLEPQPLDAEAEAARDALETHLSGDYTTDPGAGGTGVITDDDIRRAVSRNAFQAGLHYQMDGRVQGLRLAPDGRTIGRVPGRGVGAVGK